MSFIFLCRENQSSLVVASFNVINTKYYHYKHLLIMKRIKYISEATEETIKDLNDFIYELDSDIQKLNRRLGVIRSFINEKNAPKQPQGVNAQPQFSPQQGQYVKVGEFEGKTLVRDNTGRTFIVDQTGRATPFNMGTQQFDPNHNHPVGGHQDEKKGNWLTGTLGGLADGAGQILAMPGHALSGIGRGLVSENEQPKKKFRIIRK